MASYVQPDSWRGVPLEDYASEQAKKGARPKSSVLTPERVSTGLSPVPEDASSRQLDVGPVGVSRPADDDDDDDAASMRSGASRASSATYSVASLGSVISSDDMVTVRVRERRTGHMREYHATESAGRLDTPHVIINTLLPDDLAMCKLLKPNTKAAHRWECKDVTASFAWKQYRELTADGAPCRKAHALAPSRLLKMFSILTSPFKVSIFLDTDTAPCHSLETLYTQLRATDSNGLLDVYDVLMVPAREAVRAGPASKASWAEPAAWTQLNSGVIVWSSRAITKKLWQRWIALYCSESSTKDFNGGDQHFLSQALLRMVREDRLQLYQLLPQWNFRSWRRHFANGPKCCEARPADGAATDPVPIYVDHGCHKDSRAWASRRPPTPPSSGTTRPRPSGACITLEVMRDPVLLVSSGITYERSSLMEALERRPGVDPQTNAAFDGPPVVAGNITLKRAIEAWRSRPGRPAEENSPPLTVLQWREAQSDPLDWVADVAWEIEGAGRRRRATSELVLAPERSTRHDVVLHGESTALLPLVSRGIVRVRGREVPRGARRLEGLRLHLRTSGMAFLAKVALSSEVVALVGGNDNLLFALYGGDAARQLLPPPEEAAPMLAEPPPSSNRPRRLRPS
ncbi:hypothetical protein JL722_2529 [Aureococcus anophagefferens]|nr:hypothetical protein JL722_2529 [Aureococcus anophagefferens]